MRLKEIFLTIYLQYDATVPGGHGGGGEYEVQLGFGWTNGVIMDLVHRYGDDLRLEESIPEEYVQDVPQSEKMVAASSSSFGQISTALVALVISVAAGFIG